MTEAGWASTVRIDPGVDGEPVRWAREILARRTPDGPLDIEVVAGEATPHGFRCRRVEDTLRVEAIDPVGAAHGLIEITDRLGESSDPGVVLEAMDGRHAATAMPVRGIMRSFSSIDEDYPWFVSEEFWTEYLDWIAQARFSRFHLALGMQYNYGADRHGASDNYLCFAYPFLLDVPGWDVAADGVDAEERARNLRMLRFIATETRRRGMDFQLGLWNHAYDYGRNSDHRFPITGLTPETHAAYSAAAISELVQQVPQIDGFSFRVHYEGGIHDDGHEVFWGAIFDALSATGRSFQVDMHAKGVDDALLDAVNRPGLHPVLGAKYWAEHQGLPYHQASIRRREEAKPVPPGHEMTGVTEFSRRFTRYGYADFLGSDRRADLIFRVWPGTQKVLLWGDPAHAAGYGRLATFAGALGVDVCEPLYFKGRKGSGAPGRRDPYIADELRLGLRDWTKYKYTYRLWGRKLYDPEAGPDQWRGYLRETYGPLGDAVEQALAPLSRILPLVTVVHGVGGSNNGNWPEVYTNLPVTAGVDPAHHGGDTEAPPMWGTVSPFDPTTFYVIDEWAADVAAGSLDGRYGPLEVADWIEGFVMSARPSVDRLAAADDHDPQLRRTAIDAQILIRLGEFFTAKFRAAAEYALHRIRPDGNRLERAYHQLEAARTAWSAINPLVEGVYQADLRFGRERSEHGSWTDRLPAIEADVDAMFAELRRHRAGPGPATEASLKIPSRPAESGLRHQPPEDFTPGRPLELRVSRAAVAVVGVRLRYRHVNQAEHWCDLELDRDGDDWVGAVPAGYTDSPYPISYFLVADHGTDGTAVHPGLEPDLANQPYLVVMPRVS